MAKLYFRFGAMNSGKSTSLLQAAYNYEERGQHVLQVGLGQAAVAGVVEVAEPGGLGDQALDAASECIALAPVAGGLLGPDPLLGLLLTARQEGHVPGVVL